MPTSIPTVEIKSKWQSILEKNGILEKISEVTVKDAMLRGEGMGSERQLITVTFENPKLKPLNLFGKAFTSNPSHTELQEEIKSFEKEAVFLTKYVPAANEFCKRKGLGDNYAGEIYPKCYFADEKLIILENLVVDKGYTLLGKQERHSWEIAKFSIKTLAKHHAISYAMIQEFGGPNNFFNQFPNMDFECYEQPSLRKLYEPWIKSALKADILILQKSTVKGSTEAAEKLSKFLQMNLYDFLEEALKCERDQLQVLGHGDYWYANMMFLRDPTTGKVLHQKVIDLQVTRYNSPALDLVLYLFSSVQTDVRQSHFKDLLQLYLDTFHKITGNLGHSVNLSYEALFSQYQEKFRLGFWLSLIISYGPGLDIFKNTDLTANLDVGHVGEVAHKLAEQWINDNHDLVDGVAKDVVKVVREYCELE